MKISEHWQSKQNGTDNRWGSLYVSNETAGASVVPSVNGSGFYATVPALSGQTNTVIAAIRDAAGNMDYVSEDYWIDTGGSQASATATYDYDAAGCLTNLNGTSLQWDERYRLTSVSTPSTNGTSSTLSYEYDVLGRRVSRIEASVTNFFVYDGQQIVADLDGNGNILRTYVWGPGIDNLLAMTTYGTTTNTYYAIKDHQNSVIAMVDSTGSVVESYEYDAYGNTTVFNASGTELSESVIGNRYGFQGREIDWTAGLYYFRARWYNPDSGRWLSKDLIGIEGGLNQYEFCGSNPANCTDPFGKDATTAYSFQSNFGDDTGFTEGAGEAFWGGVAAGGLFAADAIMGASEWFDSAVAGVLDGLFGDNPVSDFFDRGSDNLDQAGGLAKDLWRASLELSSGGLKKFVNSFRNDCNE